MQKYKKITKFAIFFSKNFCISFIYSNFARFFDKNSKHKSIDSYD